ncbi:asparagine synthase-related protein [Ferrovibrio terrae]|uniref:asparagine synthase-related protein n=1 Tax=Ferrovibrio terrae TaxID=2594003 RepID=UPI003138194B
MSTRRFQLSVRFRPDAPAAAETGNDLFNDGRLNIRAENLHPEARLYRRRGKVLVIWGNPIAEGRIDDAAILRSFDSVQDQFGFALGLNGSFLIQIYDPETATLSVINDRFGSLAFYFRQDGDTLQLSTSFKAVLDPLLRNGKARIDPAAVFEFLHFRRLFGTHTYDSNTQYLDSASILTFTRGMSAPRVQKYWMPSFAPSALDRKTLAGDLADALRDAMAMHMSDGRRYGLMLSGGLDSRALLAAAPVMPTCFTTCLTRNNEFEVAAELAAAAGAEHVFVQRPHDMLNDLVEDSVWLSGMQIYPEFQFAPYSSAVLPKADSIFLGLALDVFFAGLYQPKKPLRIAGRETLMYQLQPIGHDPAGQFTRGVSYRLKTSDPWSVIRKNARPDLEARMHDSVNSIMARARAAGADAYGQWEYMHLHNFSRHYSFPMAASIRGWADCRIPALENRLFDMAFAVSPQDKANWAILMQAIDLCNPAMMSIRNANTNITARRSLGMQTAIHWARAAANRALGPRFRAMPPWWERSWPPARASLEHNPHIRDLVAALPESPALEMLDIFDSGKIRDSIADHAAGRHDHSVLLNLLVTIDRCLTPEADA